MSDGDRGHGTRALEAGRCRSCGLAHFPPREQCRRCWATAIERMSLSSIATLETFTIVRRAPPGLPAPYALGWGALEEGLRIFARIQAEDLAAVHAGGKMRIVVPEAADSPLPYWFEPLETG